MEEVIERVSKSVETIIKEIENLTSWLLLQKNEELEERHKLIHVGKTLTGWKDDTNYVLLRNHITRKSEGHNLLTRIMVSPTILRLIMVDLIPTNHVVTGQHTPIAGKPRLIKICKT